jgi:hypothetical protein
MRRLFACAGIGVAVLASFSAGAAANPGPARVQAGAGRIVVDDSALKPSLPAQPALGAVLSKGPQATPPALTRYDVVQSATLDNPNGEQSFGSVMCPAGTVAFGGGAVGGSFAVQQDINGSIPIVTGAVATGWEAWMDNTTGADSTFSVWAVCAKKPKQYEIVLRTYDDPPNVQLDLQDQCPLNANGKRLKVLGGGGVGSASTPGQDLHSSYPRGGTFRVWEAVEGNNTGADASLTAFAVCGSAKNWTVVSGLAVDNPPGAQTLVDAPCPAGLTAVAGGVYSNAINLLVDLNTTFPLSAADWRSYENNASGGDYQVTPWAVCVL